MADDSRRTATWGVNGFVIVVATISVALRFYTRIFTRTGIRADDWFILFALVTAWAIVALVVWGNTADPDGLRMSENTDPNYVYTPADLLYLKLSFTCAILYFAVAGSTKMGILLMYHRIFAVSTAFRYQLFIVGGLVLAWWVGCTIAAVRKCDSLEAGLASTLNDPAHCFNFNFFWLVSGICEIFLDVWIITLPVSVVVRMWYSLRQKFVVSGIFLLGAFSIISEIVKVIFAYEPSRRSLTYSNAELWAALHTGVAILCASLPIFRPLANRIAKSSAVNKISTLISHQRISAGSRPDASRGRKAKRSKSGSEGGNTGFDGSPNIPFIATEIVHGLLKHPDSAQQSGPNQVSIELREQAPRLPQIDTTGRIELTPDVMNRGVSPQRVESRVTDHGSEIYLLDVERRV